MKALLLVLAIICMTGSVALYWRRRHRMSPVFIAPFVFLLSLFCLLLAVSGWIPNLTGAHYISGNALFVHIASGAGMLGLTVLLALYVIRKIYVGKKFPVHCSLIFLGAILTTLPVVFLFFPVLSTANQHVAMNTHLAGAMFLVLAVIITTLNYFKESKN
jgi:hypothetical protein